MDPSNTTSTISKAKYLYYSGKQHEALDLLNQSLQKIQEQIIITDHQSKGKLENLSQEIELQSLYFAVQSIFLHNLNADQTISLLQEKLLTNIAKSDNVYYHELEDLLGLANYYKEMSKVDKDFSKAEILINSSLKFRENHGSVKLAYSYFHRGLIQQYSGRTSEALDSFQKANQISKSDGYLLSFITRHLGFLVQQAGKLEEAKSLFEHSLQLRLDHSIMVYVPFSCITLADVYGQLGEENKVEELLQKAVDVAQLIKLDRALALAYLTQGRFYQKSNEEKSVDAFLDSYYYAKRIDHFGIMNFISSKLGIKKGTDP